jgi:hypothetical protein
MAATDLDFMSLCDGDILENSLTESSLLDLPTPEIGLGDEDLQFNFEESFVDLSDFLLGGIDESRVNDVDSNKPVLDNSTRKVVAKSSTSRKRHASDIEGNDSVFEPMRDHSDYTCKRSCRSILSSEADESDSESVISLSSTSCMTAVERKTLRRIKNNIASRRSRETRKSKFQAMEDEAIALEKKNKELSQKVIELEAMTKHMKALLVQRLSGAPSPT